MLEFVQDLCREATGSRCHRPRMSSWKLIAPSQSSIGVDVADVATGGAGAVVPLNVKAYGSHFLCGLQSDRAAMSSQMQGYGAGIGAGAGWGLPFVGAKGLGRLPDGIKKAMLKRLGGAVQGKIMDLLKGAIWDGVSGGTRLVAGPDASGDLGVSDFHGSWATVFSLGANFVVNGVSVGMIVIAKKHPVVTVTDLIHARAIGLIGGIGLATSLDIEASQLAYRIGFN